MADEPTQAQQQALIEQWNAAWEPYRDNFAALGVALAQAVANLQPFVDDFMRAWRDEIMPRIHQAYLDAGAPYGDTSDGMLRWLREEGEIQHLQQQIEYIRQRQQMVADFRHQVQRKRGERND